MEDDLFKRCRRCGEAKPPTAFAFRRKAVGQRDNLCRPCRSAYGKQHYAANRQRYIDQARLRKQSVARERTRYLLDFFRTHPCVVCGERDPVVLEFDHLGDKHFNVCRSLADRPWQTVLDEMEKCEVVCANCHRRRTARRRGALRMMLAGD